MKICSAYHCNQNRGQIIALKVYLLVYIWLWGSFFLCKRQDISKNSNYCLNIFGLIFVALFCFIKKLILGGKTILQSMTTFPCTIWGVKPFLIWTKKKHFFLENKHIAMIWIFLDNYPFISPDNLKASLKIHLQTFLREKVSTFTVFKWYTHLLTFDSQLPSGIHQKAYQHNYKTSRSSYVYIFCISLVMWVYNTTHGFPFDVMIFVQRMQYYYWYS